MKKHIIAIALTLILIFALAFPALPVSAQDSAVYPKYIIQSGDSLGYIADLFGTTVNEIVSLNQLSNPDLVSPGDVILIPGFAGISGTLLIRPTELGEYYSYLPIKYQTEEATLGTINQILSPSQVYAGSQLIIPVQDENQILKPVKYNPQDITGLEYAALTDQNPQLLNQINRRQNLTIMPAGNVIFVPPSSNTNTVSLFAPDLTKVSLYPLPLKQGATEVVEIQADEPVTISGTLGEYTLNFFSEKSGEFVTLQGIHALAKPGLVNLTINCVFSDGRTTSYSQSVLLKPGVFDVDPPLSVDPATIDPAVTGPENELVHNLISKITPSKMWTGIFSSPAYYQEYNSLFGTRRQYNDDPTITFHTGVDFAGGLTLPITAPAPGKVVFAGPLTVRGNTVFIDHGWGVFSGFFHQDTVLVKEGDQVVTGQQIGTVGNTGRVNGSGDYYGAGAHLHWELWVNGVQVNPLDWLVQEYPDDKS